MMKINKAFNLKIVSVIIAMLFLHNTILYSQTIPRDLLRIPIEKKTCLRIIDRLKNKGLIVSRDVELLPSIPAEQIEHLRKTVHPISVQALPNGSTVVGSMDLLHYGAAIYMSDDEHVIPLLNEQGRYLAEERVGKVAVDELGNIYVAVTSTKKIRKYNDRGELLGSYDVSYKGSVVNIQGLIAYRSKLYYTIIDSDEFRVLDLLTGEDKVLGGSELFAEIGVMDLILNKNLDVIYIVDTTVMRLRTFDITTGEIGEVKEFPGISHGGGVTVDSKGKIYMGDSSRRVIHVGSSDEGYIGYIPFIEGEALSALNVDDKDNLLIGRSGGFDMVSKDAIPGLLIRATKVSEEIFSTKPLLLKVAMVEKLEEKVPSQEIMMLPDPHGELELLDRRISMEDLTELVIGSFGGYEEEPHLVSIPVNLLPASLQELLVRIQIRSISGEVVNLYEYMEENVDEVIFSPFINNIHPDGRVDQWGGMVIHEGMSKSIEELSLFVNPDRPGKRVIYVSLARLFNMQGGKITHVAELRTSQLQQMSEVDCVHHIIEEVAHVETMRLVFEGRLSTKYYDRPYFIWFEKIGTTVKLQALSSLRTALKELFPGSSQQADEFVEAYEKEAKNKIRSLNKSLELQEDDFDIQELLNSQSRTRNGT